MQLKRRDATQHGEVDSVCHRGAHVEDDVAPSHAFPHAYLSCADATAATFLLFCVSRVGRELSCGLLYKDFFQAVS